MRKKKKNRVEDIEDLGLEGCIVSDDESRKERDFTRQELLKELRAKGFKNVTIQELSKLIDCKPYSEFIIYLDDEEIVVKIQKT